MPSGEPVHQDQPGAFPPLAAAGAVAEEIAKAIGAGLRVIVRAGHPGLVLVNREPLRQIAFVRVIRHEDGLELRLGEMALLDQAAGQAQILGGPL